MRRTATGSTGRLNDGDGLFRRKRSRGKCILYFLVLALFMGVEAGLQSLKDGALNLAESHSSIVGQVSYGVNRIFLRDENLPIPCQLPVRGPEPFAGGQVFALRACARPGPECDHGRPLPRPLRPTRQERDLASDGEPASRVKWSSHLRNHHRACGFIPTSIWCL